MKDYESLNMMDILNSKKELVIDELTDEEKKRLHESYLQYKKELYKIITLEEERQLLNFLDDEK